MTRRDGALPVAAATMILLVLRIGRVYVRLKWRSKRSARTFRRELIRAGMGRERATALTEDYRNIASLTKILRENRVALPFLH